jgi:hypothetical protein
MLATLDPEGFELESMNPARRATPLSVAAHSLYEQADPLSFTEPDGTLYVDTARYVALDDRRTRVSGARWESARRTTLKVEGAAWMGHRAVLLCASADPGVIAMLRPMLSEVEKTTRAMVPGNFQLYPRLYGLDGVTAHARTGNAVAPEVFILVEVISDDEARAMAAAKTFKQFLLHHGFAGRLCTGGNVAFPFTPPELAAGSAWRFAAYHVMPADDAPELFPVHLEEI